MGGWGMRALRLVGQGCRLAHTATPLCANLPAPPPSHVCVRQGGTAQLAWAAVPGKRSPVCRATGTFYDRGSGAPTMPVEIYETRGYGPLGQRLVAVQVTASSTPNLVCTLLYTAPDYLIDAVLRCPGGKRPGRY